jgi:hypothetical protein
MPIPQAFVGHGYQIDTAMSDNPLNLFDSYPDSSETSPYCPE